MELIGRGVSRSFWFHLEAYGAGAPLFRFRRERRKRASPAKTVGFPSYYSCGVAQCSSEVNEDDADEGDRLPAVYASSRREELY